MASRLHQGWFNCRGDDALHGRNWNKVLNILQVHWKTDVCEHKRNYQSSLKLLGKKSLFGNHPFTQNTNHGITWTVGDCFIMQRISVDDKQKKKKRLKGQQLLLMYVIFIYHLFSTRWWWISESLMNYSLYELTVYDIQSLGILVCCFLSSSNGVTHLRFSQSAALRHQPWISNQGRKFPQQPWSIGCLRPPLLKTNITVFLLSLDLEENCTQHLKPKEMSPFFIFECQLGCQNRLKTQLI